MKKILLFFLLLFPLSDIKSNNIQSGIIFSPFIADTVFYENFENGFSGWTAENINNPQSASLWRLNNSRYVSPVYSVSWNDSLTNSYPHLRYESLISPPLNIPSNAKVILSFDVFIHLTPEGTSSNDNFDIQITTDNGSTWNDFSNYAYSGQQIGWKNFPTDFDNETGDLTPYAGRTVKIRFIVTTDNVSPNGEGVYIDNFRVVKTDCETTDIFEPNNTNVQATPVQHSQQIDAALCPLGDVDFYSFQVSQNDKINIMAQYSIYQITLSLFSPSGTMVASTGNKNLNYNAQVNGTYFLKVSLPDFLSYTPDYSLYINVINTKPDVISVSDIEGDQGFQVRLQWQHSLFDPPDSVSTIQQYYIFRKVNDTLNMPDKAVIPLTELKAADLLAGTIFFELDEYWDYVAAVPAVSPRPFDNYNYTAPTLNNNIESTFRIAAVSKNSTQPVLWGMPGSGISIDNVQPQFVSTSILSGNGSNVLNWETDKNTSPDVMYIKIYRGMFQRFAPAQNSITAILPPGIKSYTDHQNIPGECFYIIGVSDFSGNETYSAPLKGTILGGDELKDSPDKFILKQNYPNPFNPETYIEFSIPEDALVTLKIYDILGREVSEIIHENYSPGSYKIRFNAKELSSGTYFYLLKAGDNSITRKLTVLK